MVVWFTVTYVIYYWDTRGSPVPDHMVVWFTTTCHILLKYKGSSWSWSYGGVICSCKSHHHMIRNRTAPCISVIYDICSCKSHHIWLRPRVWFTTTCHILLKYKGSSWSWSYGGVIYNYICHILMKYKRPSWSWSYGGVCKSHDHMITTTTASCIFQ
jgi:hypothetical protein